MARSVLDGGSPLPLSYSLPACAQSARGLAHSQTWRKITAVVAALVRARLTSLGRVVAWSIQSQVSRRLTTAATVAILFAAFTLRAQPFAIDSYTIDGGGGTSTNTQYAVSGTIGQPDAGTLAGGQYALQGGFWSIVVAVQTPGAPHLTVKRAGSNVELSWPAEATGFVLEETLSLSGTINWLGSGATPAVIEGQSVVTLSIQPGQHFFRLRKP